MPRAIIPVAHDRRCCIQQADFKPKPGCIMGFVARVAFSTGEAHNHNNMKCRAQTAMHA